LCGKSGDSDTCVIRTPHYLDGVTSVKASNYRGDRDQFTHGTTRITIPTMYSEFAVAVWYVYIVNPEPDVYIMIGIICIGELYAVLYIIYPSDGDYDVATG
jgi:hypothetical protein